MFYWFLRYWVYFNKTDMDVQKLKITITELLLILYNICEIKNLYQMKFFILQNTNLFQSISFGLI